VLNNITFLQENTTDTIHVSVLFVVMQWPMFWFRSPWVLA